MKLWIDLETFCEVPITNGTHAYAEHAEVMLIAFAIDDEPAQLVDLTLPGSREGLMELLGCDVGAASIASNSLAKLVAAVQHATEVWAHNSHFDRTVMRHALGIEWPIDKWRDTMVQALSHSLPAGLAGLCEAIGLPSDKQKDVRGNRLVQLFCKPLGSNRKLRRATRETHPAEWAEFCEYAIQDVEAMRAAHKAMPKLNYPNNERELALWHLDQTINDRGVCVDVALIDGAIAAVERNAKALKQQTAEHTKGVLQSTSQTAALNEYIFEQYGIDLPNVTKATVTKLLNTEIDSGLRELLVIRQQSSASSTAKYGKLKKGLSCDGRVRGLLQFNGASRTGRWSGRLFQPQNLPRPTVRGEALSRGIELLKSGDLELGSTDPVGVCTSAIRGVLCAAPKRRWVSADLANIEGRVLAWLAGEDWKLRAFAEFDSGEGPDMYIRSYAAAFSVSVDSVTNDQRQVGKVMELALGYQGGVGAFLTFASAYSIDLDDLAKKVLYAADERLVVEASKFREWMVGKGKRLPVKKDAFIACDVLKRAWREAHSATTELWRNVEACAFAALNRQGVVHRAGLVEISCIGAWLRIKLPSGRSLCYAKPHEKGGAFHYWGVKQPSGKWGTISTYGGKLVENITQAVARDVIANNVPLIENAGYPMVLSVHDEACTEPPDEDCYNGEHLASLLSATPAWAQGLPLAAKGETAYRFS